MAGKLKTAVKKAVAKKAPPKPVKRADLVVQRRRSGS